jgi:phosphoribosylanthranilate isomerase
VLWIKICGMTDARAVGAALAAGADALGFVFAPSARRLSAAAAALLARPARGRAACVAVMRHPQQREVDEVLQEFAPDVLQTDWPDLGQLALPPTLTCLPVLRSGMEWPARLPARVLFEGAVSGAGALCDWNAAGALAARTQLVLAGGLDPTNVAAGVAAVGPWGVDVSSGVEASPGSKDPAAIVRFIAAARGAAGGGRP